MDTKREVRAVVDVIVAVAETVRQVREIPSGHLYAQVMTAGISLATYERVVGVLKGAGLVEERNHVLRWVGPELDTLPPSPEPETIPSPPPDGCDEEEYERGEAEAAAEDHADRADARESFS